MNVPSRNLIWLLIAAQLAVAVMLFWGPNPRHGYNYYVLLRWLVVAVSVFSLYSYREHWAAWLVFLPMVIVFNPMMPLKFSKDTWAWIDLGTAALFVGASVTSSAAAGKFIGGAACLLFAFWFGSHIASKLVTAIRLHSGQQTEGEVVSSDERIEDCDACPGHIRRFYDVVYRFSLPNGKSVEAIAELRFQPNEKVTVIYDPANPTQSRLAENGMTTIAGALFETVYMGFFVVVAVYGGIYQFRKGWKELSTVNRVLPSSQ